MFSGYNKCNKDIVLLNFLFLFFNFCLFKKFSDLSSVVAVVTVYYSMFSKEWEIDFLIDENWYLFAFYHLFAFEANHIIYKPTNLVRKLNSIFKSWFIWRYRNNKKIANANVRKFLNKYEKIGKNTYFCYYIFR